jgi:hypothetical protein
LKIITKPDGSPIGRINEKIILSPAGALSQFTLSLFFQG